MLAWGHTQKCNYIFIAKFDWFCRVHPSILNWRTDFSCMALVLLHAESVFLLAIPFSILKRNAAFSQLEYIIISTQNWIFLFKNMWNLSFPGKDWTCWQYLAYLSRGRWVAMQSQNLHFSSDLTNIIHPDQASKGVQYMFNLSSCVDKMLQIYIYKLNKVACSLHWLESTLIFLL